MKTVFLSALHKSSGKTLLSVGLSRALTLRGQTVQPFKKGPDYIDPMWLGRSARRACFNLDFHTMSKEVISSTFTKIADGADFALVEGNKGLFDGVDLEGNDSNAALAKLLGTPVVVVVDTRGMTRGVAPILLGYQAFDKQLLIAGVILNQVGGSRHEHKLRASIEHYTDVPVIGAIGRHKEMSISERHLGLIPTNEDQDADTSISNIARIVEQSVDLDHFQSITSSASNKPKKKKKPPIINTNIRIAIARDTAFGFYYHDDLNAFKQSGATLVPFNALTDKSLPEADGLLIGGGFPETHSTLLEKNESLKDDIKNRLDSGMPAYAECGGLIYLARSLTWQGNTHQMVGVIPGDIIMHQKPIGRGYVKLNETDKYPWGSGAKSSLNAHEFHYASLENLPTNIKFAYDVERGYGINGSNDGIVIDNLLASFSHQRNIGENNWVERFTSFVRDKKDL
jgi:cobyrinic acid a,c-diamide synthase